MPYKMNPLDEQVLAGPYTLFEDSFILEFLKPAPSRDATVLMRATYKYGHPLRKKGKQHPQSPPLHIHFDQIETFKVLRGTIGTTRGYELTDTILTPANTPDKVDICMPHNFWPDPNATEDSTLLVWAHPSAVPAPMDALFFKNLLVYVSDVASGKVKMDMLQMMLTQHVTNTAMIMFPKAWWLGPIRWWIPWHLQGAMAGIARLMGYTPQMKAYTSDEDRRLLGKVGWSE